jgi:hypothetical protein
VPPTPELVTRSVRVYCAKVKAGSRTANAQTARIFIANLIFSFFLPCVDVVRAESLVEGSLAVFASWRGLREELVFFRPVQRSGEPQAACQREVKFL